MAFKILSLNVQGFNSPIKRTKAFTFFSSLQADVICLQETHFSHTSFPKYFHKKFSRFILSTSSTKTKGVGIFFHTALAVSIDKTPLDPEGRYIIANVCIGDSPLTIVTYYTPNIDQVDFFFKLFDLCYSNQQGPLILCGDSNLVWNNRLDRLSLCGKQTSLSALKATRSFSELLNSFSLIDAWREKNPEVKQFSHYSAPHKVSSRIDHIFLSPSLVPLLYRMLNISGLGLPNLLHYYK
uniref:exodeoxyribonuclease III n=1 Tax=Xenopus tropicalis TaxID=8364 RepID=L7N3M1_XENTR